MLGKRGVTRLA